ncbi:7-cyano-7-deazaguanine synthase [Candidatus Babeliales bacterium]|nr:7-cyano-7-deazaguanine synthase [Candidatus Babeliales bacterium]
MKLIKKILLGSLFIGFYFFSLNAMENIESTQKVGSAETKISEKNFKNEKKEIVVLYSGGLDSSALVGMCGARKYDIVHLLTFDNGAQYNLEMSKIKLDEFRRVFPKTTFIHKIISVRYLFKEISLIDIEEDILQYKTNLLCVGCKMSMHAFAVIYAKENNINIVIDGFVKRQNHFPEQDQSFIDEIKKIYKKYNVVYKSPLYFIVQEKKDVKNILSRYNLSTKSIEPECLFGNTFSTSTSKNIRKYIRSKRKKTYKFIDEFLKESTLLI